MKVWQNAGQFDPARGSFSGWLVQIVRRTAIDMLRQRKRKPEGDSLWEVEDRLISEEWLDQDRLDSLRRALENLPVDQRSVIELAYFGGLSQSEIAERLGIPLGTVKTRQRLAMQKLREVWLGD